MSDGPLAGMAALVTGGGSGIGLACARWLRRDGATVTLAGRSEDRLRAAADALTNEAGAGDVRTAVCDVAREDDVRRAVEAAATDGGLHIAVAGAGTGTAGPLVATDVAQWQRVLDVNLTGAFLTIKHAGAALAASGGGAIVAISSIAAPLTHRLMTPYVVSKAGLEALVRNAADELGAAGVRVNAVRPGLVPTDLSTGLTASEAIVGDYLDQMPLRRLGTVDDIAAGVRFLAGPESSWVTGQCLGIDGGHTLRRGPDIAVAFR
ncbi:MAG TPA: SDR family oxidoreductase [Acidimicrobiales bacterium]|nr:SDR family oxidoreductase [Acidimicrobiales bacterium]